MSQHHRFRLAGLALLLPFVLSGLCSTAQPLSPLPEPGTVHDGNLVSYRVPADRTLHILAPEPIVYVDISSPDIDGDLPEKNLCRLKPVAGRVRPGQSFTVTLVTASLIAVCRLTVTDSLDCEPRTYLVTLEPRHWVRMHDRRITEPEFRSLALRAMASRSYVHGVRGQAPGLRYRLNNLFVVGDYLLLDLVLENNSNLNLDIDEVRFTLSGRRPATAQVSQETPLTPLYTYQAPTDVLAQANWRNFYLFPRFHFTSDKVLRISLAEEQVSGRTLELQLDHRRLMQVRTLE